MAGLLLPAGFYCGCESTGGGAQVGVGVYYGTGWYDPWYNGSDYYPPDVIVTPPEPGRPDLKPEHPIVKPTPPPRPAPGPMPSIPSSPRPSGRAGRR
ncbi:MAG: hypothetical protein U1F98_11850 [Verrucomicrobiota bacterium]